MIPCEFYRHRLFIASLLLASSALLASGCSRATSAASAPDAPQTAYLAYARGFVDIEGGLISIAASSNGLIKEVRVEEGDKVRAGQVLAAIDDRQARLALAVSTASVAEARAALLPIQARLAAAKRQAERLQPLLPTEAVAAVDAEKASDLVSELQAEIAVATAAIATAEARMRADEFDVDQHAIHASADGRIVRRSVRAGDVVSSLGAPPLFVLEPNAPHIVRADLDERYVDKVSPGMAAEVVLDNDRVLTASILRIGEVFGAKLPTGEPGERVDLRAVECIVALKDASLRVGQRVLVRVPKP